MNRWKRMCAALAAAALLAGLTACQSGSVTDNANTYVQGLLDASYLGEISTDYLKVTEYAGREAAEADYESYMAQEAEDLLSYLIVSKPTQAVTQRAQEVIRAIYSHAQYTVAPAEELESGDVTVDVTIPPLEFPAPLSAAAPLPKKRALWGRLLGKSRRKGAGSLFGENGNGKQNGGNA